MIWTSWAGFPQSAFVDRGKEFAGDFEKLLKAYGVEFETAALEAPEQLGRAERSGGVWEEVYRRIVVDCQIQGLDDIRTVSTIVTQVKSESILHDGHAPSNWVLGARGLRVPGSVLQDAEVEKLEVQEAALDPESSMAANLLWREAAKVAFIRLDNSDRVRRARLSATTPSRGPFPLGSYVYFRRKMVQPSEIRSPTHRWFGVARVIGHDAQNPERLEDRGLRPPHMEGAPHAIWLRYGKGTIVGRPEQLRFASEDDLVAWQNLPTSETREPTGAGGARNFFVIRGEADIEPEDIHEGERPEQAPGPPAGDRPEEAVRPDAVDVPVPNGEEAPST